MKYIIWYSWWIDSSFVAWSLKCQWHEVLLVNLKITDEPNKCCNINSEIIVSAKNLWLKLEIVDIIDEFKEWVIKDFISEYVCGRTPNPCVKCNELVRFKMLEQLRQKYWYDFVATGHYAKLINIDWNNFLWVWLDKYKDQTYMLYRLANVQNSQWEPILKYIDLIMWNYEKTQVIKIINQENLPIVLARESQNICFIPDDDYKRFIKQNSNYSIIPWPIYDVEWKYLWEHKWIIFYTIWQRHWINISWDKKLYVVKINSQNNSIILWPEEDLFTKTLEIRDFFVLNNQIKDSDFIDGKIFWKIRYHHPLVQINRFIQKENNLIIEFDQVVRAVTPGQHCVLYKSLQEGTIVVWWWIII